MMDARFGDLDSRRSPSAMEEIFIEFDGGQLLVRTDVPLVLEFLGDTFRNMIVPNLTSSAGTLSVLAQEGSYRIESADDRVVEGDQAEHLLNLVKEEVRFQFMRARRDLLWLHAAAVERGGSALLLCGPSGQGKSTLGSALCERGWRLMSDDVAPVRMDADEVLAYCQSPVRRVRRDRKLEPQKRKGLARQKVSLPSGKLHLAPTPIGAMVFLTFSPGNPPLASRLSQGEMAMAILRNSTNLNDHKEMAVKRAASMARSLLGESLSYGYTADAVEMLDSLR